jgi:hypothetical protein
MRIKIKRFIETNYKSVEEYALDFGFNADSTRKALTGKRMLSTAMIATVSEGAIPVVRKEIKVFYEYET